MNDFEKKVLGYTVGSALIAAGIGTYINRKKQDKKRKLISSPQKSPNAIIVDVDANNFLRGLATPAELAASRGESPKEIAGKAIDVAKGVTNEPGSIIDTASMSDKDILAKKKAILSAKARKLNFIGGVKKAEECSDSDKTNDGDKDDGKTKDIDVKHVDKTKDQDSARVIPPRDEQGRFVSPMDPVAVNVAEKAASAGNSKTWGEFLWNTVAHPIDTASAFFERNSTIKKPLLYSLGIIGSSVLAGIIVDKVNERRAKKSNNDVSKAREQYSRLLQSPESQEKDAAANEESKENTINTVLGGAFIVPAVLTAYIANKVMENRSKEEKKKKKLTNSIPNEPIILYRTVGTEKMASHTIEVSPEAILASLYATECFIKQADFVNAVVDSTRNAVKAVGDAWDNSKALANLYMHVGEDGKMKDSGYKWLASPEADALWRQIIKSEGGPGGRFIAQKLGLDRQRLQDVIVQRAMNKNDPVFGPLVAKSRKEYMDEKFGNWGFTDKGFGGWLKSIMEWFMDTFNIGRDIQEKKVQNIVGQRLDKIFPQNKATKPVAQPSNKSSIPSQSSTVNPPAPTSGSSTATPPQNVTPPPVAPYAGQAVGEGHQGQI